MQFINKEINTTFRLIQEGEKFIRFFRLILLLDHARRIFRFLHNLAPRDTMLSNLLF